MADITATAKRFLDEAEFRYTFNEERNSYEFGLKLENGSAQVRFICRDDDDYSWCLLSGKAKCPSRLCPPCSPS